MKLALIAIATTATILSGCAAPRRTAPSGIVINAHFDTAQADALLAKGEGTIKGNAFLRQPNGSVVTCAGAKVTLVPATRYAEERIKASFRSDARKTAYRNWFTRRNITTRKIDNENFWKKTKQTQCDSRGDFTFENVADGDFFVFTDVIWTAADKRYGGRVVRRVSVKNGETASVVMSP